MRLNRIVDFRRAGKFNFYYLDSEAVGRFLNEVFGMAGGVKHKVKLGPVTLTLQGREGK